MLKNDLKSTQVLKKFKAMAYLCGLIVCGLVTNTNGFVVVKLKILLFKTV